MFKLIILLALFNLISSKPDVHCEHCKQTLKTGGIPALRKLLVTDCYVKYQGQPYHEKCFNDAQKYADKAGTHLNANPNDEKGVCKKVKWC